MSKKQQFIDHYNKVAGQLLFSEFDSFEDYQERTFDWLSGFVPENWMEKHDNWLTVHETIDNMDVILDIKATPEIEESYKSNNIELDLTIGGFDFSVDFMHFLKNTI